MLCVLVKNVTGQKYATKLGKAGFKLPCTEQERIRWASVSLKSAC